MAEGYESDAEECETMICPRCLRENPAEIHTCQATPAWHKLESEIAEMHRENSRLRAELADKTKRLDRIATLLTENEPGIIYYGLDDDVGDHGCCGLLSYKPHAPDCWFAECRALAAKGE